MKNITAPIIYRAASKGKIFTRQERIAIINANKAVAKRMSERKEMILKERAKAKDETASRVKFFEGVHVRLEHPKSVVRKSKDGSLFIQPRVNGSFGPKITL
jgi:hypothetical protein